MHSCVSESARLSLGLYDVSQVSRQEKLPVDELLAYALESGIDVIDIGFPEYLGDSSNVECLKFALKQHDGRLRVRLCVSVASCRNEDELLCSLKGKLDLLGLDCVYAITFGPVNRGCIERLKTFDFSGALGRCAKEGIFREAGIWLYDRYESLEPALALSPLISFVRMDYCVIDCTNFPGEYGILYGKKLNLPIINGSVSSQGKMLLGCHDSFSTILARYGKTVSLHEQLVKWAAHNSNINSLTINPKNKKEFENLLRAYRCSVRTKPTIKDVMMQNDMRDAHRDARPYNCASCGCCFPCVKGTDNYRACPFDVDMPALVALYNDRAVFGEDFSSLMGKLIGYAESACKSCKRCDKECPKLFPVSTIVKEMQVSIKPV